MRQGFDEVIIRIVTLHIRPIRTVSVQRHSLLRIYRLGRPLASTYFRHSSQSHLMKYVLLVKFTFAFSSCHFQYVV